MKLLLIGASNYVSQKVIKSLSNIDKIIGISLEEDTDRHKDYLALEQKNLDKYFLDITKDFPKWLDKLIAKYQYFDTMLYMPCENSFKSFLDITKDDFDRSVLVNGYLPFAISQKLIPGMIENKKGRIVLISSIWSEVAEKDKNNFDYSATKALMNQTVRQITANYMSQNITSTALYFGTSEIHQTMRNEKFPQFEGKRAISFDETANVIVDLLNPNKRSFAGASLMLDGGDFHITGL